ncbi:hypothetical protein EB118_24835 [bacterium]|nr:hypothetical protein [bacterium]NDD85102.1 hypothetical protein [bacterium]NDG33280.1 hypothetical protein [bacterium]
MKPNAEYRLAVYMILFFVYLVKTEWEIKNKLPQPVYKFLNDHHDEIICVSYLFLAYYYYALEYD